MNKVDSDDYKKEYLSKEELKKVLSNVDEKNANKTKSGYYMGEDLEKIIRQIRIDLGFWCLCIERKVIIDKAEKEIKSIILELQNEYGLSMNQIYKKVVSYLPIDYTNSRLNKFLESKEIKRRR